MHLRRRCKWRLKSVKEIKRVIKGSLNDSVANIVKQFVKYDSTEEL